MEATVQLIVKQQLSLQQPSHTSRVNSTSIFHSHQKSISTTPDLENVC